MIDKDALYELTGVPEDPSEADSFSDSAIAEAISQVDGEALERSADRLRANDVFNVVVATADSVVKIRLDPTQGDGGEVGVSTTIRNDA